MAPTPYPVEIEDLVARYGERKVLDGVSLKIPRGTVTVILGGSGCGKSTLLKHIIGLLTPSEGKIRLFGEAIDRLPEEERERLLPRLGMLFQNGALISSLTISENVALPLREFTTLPEEVIAELVRMKLDLVELGEAGGLLPSELSGGMRKRAALARAIALDPELLCCDEPSAGLDPLSAAALDHLLLKLKRIFEMTLIVVTHELESIRLIADQVVMLDRGRVIAFGPLAEVERSTHPFIRNFFERRVGEEGRPPSVLAYLRGEGR